MITLKQYQRLEKESGLPQTEILEIIGKNIVNEIKRRLDIRNKSILILCGHGINGSHGFAIAKNLKETSSSSKVSILFVGKKEKLNHESKLNYFKVLPMIKTDLSLIEKSDILIDAILNIPIKKLENNTLEVIDKFNSSKAYKISIDIPTGLNPDNGEIKEKAINPDLVLTLHDYKQGLTEYLDKTTIINIGLKK